MIAEVDVGIATRKSSVPATSPTPEALNDHAPPDAAVVAANDVGMS
jgi:hypothetical protein